MLRVEYRDGIARAASGSRAVQGDWYGSVEAGHDDALIAAIPVSGLRAVQTGVSGQAQTA